MLILRTTGGPSTLVKLIDFKPSSFFFFANLTRLSKNSNSHGIARMVSIGDNEIFPLMKCVNIFDFTTELLPSSTSTASLSFVVSSSIASIGKHLLGILALEKNHVWCHKSNSTTQALLLHHQLKPPSSCWQ
jgi:hypothetical protein